MCSYEYKLVLHGIRCVILSERVMEGDALKTIVSRLEHPVIAPAYTGNATPVVDAHRIW